ncbi:MAG: DNA repair protein RecN [Pseudomonadota bacterium]
MLTSLAIKNFAIIDDLQIGFDRGLTILSGETGAGKSIIVNAVNLLLGSRATAKMVRSGADSAELEAVFAVPAGSPVDELIRKNGLPSDGTLRIRRIISIRDRHKIIINEQSATIQLLTDLTTGLASISGQHAHQVLLKEDTHLLILDQFGGLTGLRQVMAEQVVAIRSAVDRLGALQEQQKRQQEQMALLEYQKKEISAAALSDIREDDFLEERRRRLKHAVFLYQAVYDGVEQLYSADGAVVERIHGVVASLQRAADIDGALAPAVDALTGAVLSLEDTAVQLRSYLGGLDMDDSALEHVEDRLDTLNRLKKKYGGSLEAVSHYYDRIDAELDAVRNISEAIAEAAAALDTLHRSACETAARLSAGRRERAPVLARKVADELVGLEMPGVEVELVVEDVSAGARVSPFLIDGVRALSDTGSDQATFYISANPGEAMKPLSSVASGGELSRVVLGIKAILARTDAVETIVFDEVDAGIGGRVAARVGRKLLQLADCHQIICITHLPQIAIFGHHHFRIAKHTAGGRTATRIQMLDDAQRVEEIARMLGGATITATTRRHAQEMLQSAQTPEG